MLLLLLARAQRGEPPDLTYSELDAELSRLLREFGPPRGRQQTEFPFWHLQSEGIWIVRDAAGLPLRKGSRNPARKTLLTRDAAGYVPLRHWLAIAKDPGLRAELTQRLLSEFWPATLHEPIRQALDLCVSSPPTPEERLRETVTRVRRDRSFRDLVLALCGTHCQVCSFDGRLSGDPLALEVAHLRWHCYGGPDEPANALALCSFHHVALDRGAIGITESQRLAVSPHVDGPGTEEWLQRFAGQPLRRAPGAPPLRRAFLRWHAKEVYRG
jgi:putative restriction endonuclease